MPDGTLQTQEQTMHRCYALKSGIASWMHSLQFWVPPHGQVPSLTTSANADYGDFARKIGHDLLVTYDSLRLLPETCLPSLGVRIGVYIAVLSDSGCKLHWSMVAGVARD